MLDDRYWIFRIVQIVQSKSIQRPALQNRFPSGKFNRASIEDQFALARVFVLATCM
jgi:hypothetical protein